VSVVPASDEGRDHAVRRATSGRRIALLVCLALLGFATTYAFIGGSQALAGTTTVPNPDPPPPPIRHPQPPPPPPPPPPPVQTYQPPPPPPPARAPNRKVVAKHQRRQPRSPHAKPPPAPRAALVVLQPQRPARSDTLGPSLAQVAANQTISTPFALEFFLALMIAVSVLVAALAVAPRRAVPRPLLGVVGGQRELLFLVALALVAASGFVLLLYVLAVR
jgi:type IV secretory pathway VirB10-like protein